MGKENIILERSFAFSLEIISYCEALEKQRKFVVAGQLLRAGTSVGASIREAQNAESKADFIHKMKIAAKEADETEYWLLLCNESKNYKDPGDLLLRVKSIQKLLSRIITTSKSNQK